MRKKAPRTGLRLRTRFIQKLLPDLLCFTKEHAPYWPDLQTKLALECRPMQERSESQCDRVQSDVRQREATRRAAAPNALDDLVGIHDEG